MKLPHNSPDVKSISEENYVLVKARGNLCWCSWDVILFLLFPLCTSEQLETKKKKTRLWIFFFTLVHFLLLFFPFVFLSPLLSSMFIASDGKLPYNNPVMIVAMISTSVRQLKQAQRWFPHGQFRKVRVTFWVLPSAGQGRAGYESPVNVPSRRWHASWN